MLAGPVPVSRALPLLSSCLSVDAILEHSCQPIDNMMSYQHNLRMRWHTSSA
jgi:hypothetical protein